MNIIVITPPPVETVTGDSRLEAFATFVGVDIGKNGIRLNPDEVGCIALGAVQ